MHILTHIIIMNAVRIPRMKSMVRIFLYVQKLKKLRQCVDSASSSSLPYYLQSGAPGAFAPRTHATTNKNIK